MPTTEVGLIARAKGLATRLLTRRTLEVLAEADDLGALARGVSRHAAAFDPIGVPLDAFAIERAVGRTAGRHLQTLYRWQEREHGVLDIFAAHQDRRSLRALLRGAAEGAPSSARLEGLLATPSLPQLALTELAQQASPRAVVERLTVLAHPDARRLLPFVHSLHADLFGIDVALLMGFAERATRVADRTDETQREFVRSLIDLGNVQNALVLSGEPRDIHPSNPFVPGGRSLSLDQFMSAARAGSQQRALTILAATLAGSPLASSLPAAPGDVAHLDRAFLVATLTRLTRAARIEPLSSAPVLRVLLLIEAQGRDLRTLAWGAVLGTPASLRRRQLVTPG